MHLLRDLGRGGEGASVGRGVSFPSCVGEGREGGASHEGVLEFLEGAAVGLRQEEEGDESHDDEEGTEGEDGVFEADGGREVGEHLGGRKGWDRKLNSLTMARKPDLRTND